KLTILMQSFWQQYYGSDPQVLGKTVTLNAAPYTVVGVMPASFKFPGESDVQMLLPLQLNEASERLRVRQQFVRIIGLLKPGVSLACTFADLDAIRKRAQPAVFGGPGPGDAAGGPSTMPAPPPGPHSMMGITGPGPGPAPAPAGSAGNTITMPAGPSSEQHPRPPARELGTSPTQAGGPGANAPPPGP